MRKATGGHRIFQEADDSKCIKKFTVFKKLQEATGDSRSLQEVAECYYKLECYRML